MREVKISFLPAIIGIVILFTAGCLGPATPNPSFPSDPNPDNSIPLQSGQWTLHERHDGIDRFMNLYIPDELPDGPVPLVLSFHGYLLTAYEQSNIDGFYSLADEEKFIAGWVQASQKDRSWNIGKANCIGDAARNDIDDVGLVKKMVSKIIERCKNDKNYIDPEKVYAYGHSNGAGLVHTLARNASDVFAAISPASFPVSVPGTEPFQDVSVIQFHGDNDHAINYDGGSLQLGTCEYSSAALSLESWKDYNGCMGDALLEQHPNCSCQTYTNCNGGKEVKLCTLPGGGHNPGGWNIDVAKNSWDFMSRFTCEGCNPPQ